MKSCDNVLGLSRELGGYLEDCFTTGAIDSKK